MGMAWVGGPYIKQESNEFPTCGEVEENETMPLLVMAYMEIQPDTKLSDGLFAGLAALRKCQHYIIRRNNTVEINGSISQPSTSLTALPFSAILSRCQTLMVIKMTGLCSLKKIHWCSFPCVRHVLSTLQNELNWSQIVIDPGLFLPLSYSGSPFLVLASMKSTLCAKLTRLHEALL